MPNIETANIKVKTSGGGRGIFIVLLSSEVATLSHGERPTFYGLIITKLPTAIITLPVMRFRVILTREIPNIRPVRQAI